MRKILPYCHSLFSLEKVKGASNYKIIKIIKSGRLLDLAYQLGAMTRRDCHVASLLTMTAILFSFNANAECTPTPDCASIGYTETSCETDYLACPFDSTKLKCMPCDSSFRYDCVGENITGGTGDSCDGKYVTCECSEGFVFQDGACACDDSCTVGAIYYSDGTCSACVDNKKTAIGIVVKDNELVMSWRRSYTVQWGTYGPNITDLNDLTEEQAIEDINGKDNTAKIVAFQTAKGTTASNSAAINCHEYSTEGTNAGDWYLPAFGELYNYVYENYNSKLKSATNKLRWTWTKDLYFWSSSEANTYSAWNINPINGYVSDLKKTNTKSLTCFLEIN